MDRLLSTYSVTQECAISTRQLYYWELIGLIQPHYETFGSRRFRRYTSEDLGILKKIKSLLDEGFTLQAVRERILKNNAENFPPVEVAS